jgi:Fe-S-cluster containining protein
MTPCNGCTLCCKGSLIPLMPQDDPGIYDTVKVMGIESLKISDGACIYLGAGGCTIYETRPIVCRVFDCAGFVKFTNKGALRQMMTDGLASKAIVRRGKELLRRGHRPDRAEFDLCFNADPRKQAGGKLREYALRARKAFATLRHNEAGAPYRREPG